MKVKELFDGEYKWTKRHYTVVDGEIWRYCLAGAIYTCYTEPKERNEVLQKVADALLDLNADALLNFSGKPSDCTIIAWNDTPERTFSDVIELVEKLDI